MKFALYFGNRGFMPAELIAGARADMIKAVTDAGYEYLAMDENATRYGAVETREEGRMYHDWLKSHEGEYDGVILCMPIFIDENGAAAALQDANVPILMQAYPDEIGKMDFAHRRDAFCGKFSVTDVFYQYKIPFTVMKPHVVHPLSEAFRKNLEDFAAVCRVVKGMRRFNLGCIGARTTAFKTVRFDEVTLQRYGINVESFDLSELVFKVGQKKMTTRRCFLRSNGWKATPTFRMYPKKISSPLPKSPSSSTNTLRSIIWMRSRSGAGTKWRPFCAYVRAYSSPSLTTAASSVPARSTSVPPSLCGRWRLRAASLRRASTGTIITATTRTKSFSSTAGLSRSR